MSPVRAVPSVALVAAAIGAAYAMAGGKGHAGSFSLKDFNLPSTPERVSKPKGSSKSCNNGVALWALVDADGSVSASCGVTEVGIYPPGFYVVSFNKNISSCAYQVTQGIKGEIDGTPFAAVPMYLRPGLEVDTNSVGAFLHGARRVHAQLLPQRLQPERHLLARSAVRGRA